MSIKQDLTLLDCFYNFVDTVFYHTLYLVSFPVIFYLQLRREGARLFMLWFQALQENSDEFCQLIYACLIPGFPNPIDNVEWTNKSKLSRAGAEEIFLSISDAGFREQLSSSSNVHLPSDGESEGQVKYLSCYKKFS